MNSIILNDDQMKKYAQVKFQLLDKIKTHGFLRKGFITKLDVLNNQKINVRTHIDHCIQSANISTCSGNIQSSKKRSILNDNIIVAIKSKRDPIFKEIFSRAFTPVISEKNKNGKDLNPMEIGKKYEREIYNTLEFVYKSILSSKLGLVSVPEPNDKTKQHFKTLSKNNDQSKFNVCGIIVSSWLREQRLVPVYIEYPVGSKTFKVECYDTDSYKQNINNANPTPKKPSDNSETKKSKETKDLPLEKYRYVNGRIDLLCADDKNTYKIFDVKTRQSIKHNPVTFFDILQLHLYAFCFQLMHPEAVISELGIIAVVPSVGKLSIYKVQFVKELLTCNIICKQNKKLVSVNPKDSKMEELKTRTIASLQKGAFDSLINSFVDLYIEETKNDDDDDFLTEESDIEPSKIDTKPEDSSNSESTQPIRKNK